MRALFFLMVAVNSFAADWTELALRLTGESDKIRAAALKELQDIPNLKLQLKEALPGPSTREQHLALDVIAALSLHEFLPELIKRVSDDEDGRFSLTLNTLLHSGNRLKIAKHYQELLKSPAPVLVKVIALDTLSRMEVNLSREELEKYLKDPSTEIRSAALSYLRAQLVRLPRREDLGLLALPFSDRAFQIRVQAAQVVRDLPDVLEIDGLFLLEACREDPHPEVKKVCGGGT